MGVQGVDYAGDHPSPTGLWNVGKRFACRYFGPGGAWKHATPDECRALAAAGLFIVTNAEGLEAGLLGGRSVGAEWARQAHDHAVRCGMPPDRPVYLSVDFDVSAAQWPAVAEALRGAAAEIGVASVGVYGGYDAIAWAARDKVARWFWQTAAWSEGRWHPMAHIRQYRNGVSLVGGTVDLDEAMVTQYGQWKPVGTAPPGNGDDDMTPPEFLAILNDPKVAAQMRAFPWQYNGGGLSIPDPPGGQASALKEFDATYLGVGALTDQLNTVAAAVATVATKVDALESAPAVDPVALAAAIVAHPEIAASLADQVAARLGRIEGEITLSGGANLGIRPDIG